MIPKIIWQTHNYKWQDLPEVAKLCAKTWKNMNPGWEYRYIDHIERETFVLEQDPHLHKIYLQLQPIAQADLWRYLVVYKFGGVYADMDSVCKKELVFNEEEDLIYALTHSSDFKEMKPNNAHFAAIKKSKTLEAILEIIKNTDMTNDTTWGCWRVFSNYLYTAENVSDTFDFEIHSRDFHRIFPYDIEVKRNGKTVTLRDIIVD